MRSCWLGDGKGERLSNTLPDDRTLHELYLWPFAEGVRAGVGSVMTAYNGVSLSPTPASC
ncbi:hypothetical protein IMZ48_21845 [Candidatus Bathyarchaeota archaeon]|nr:hypothetical protein [Candidatus Bathyarchaeota archaeon]